MLAWVGEHDYRRGGASIRDIYIYIYISCAERILDRVHMGWCRTHAACGAVRSIHRVSIYVSLAQHHDSCRYRSEINNLHFIHTRTMFVLLTPSFCSTVASSHRSVEHLRTMVQCRSEELCESHMLIFWLRSLSFSLSLSTYTAPCVIVTRVSS